MTTVWKRIIASAVAWAMYPSINTLFLAAIVSTAVITDPKKDNYTCDVPKDNKATPIKIKEKCKSCNGLGFVRNNNPNSSSDITYKVCKTCNGSGTVVVSIDIDKIDTPKRKIKEKCKSCNGLGFVRNNNPNSSSDITYKVCKTCNGSGMVYL